MDQNILISIGVATVGALILDLIFNKINSKSKVTTSIQPTQSPEHYKLSYSIFMTQFNEFKEYFIKYELSKVSIVHNNELIESEYKLLAKKFISQFIERHGQSKMVLNMIEYNFGSVEAMTMYLQSQFDLMLLDNYQLIGFSERKNYFENGLKA